MFQKDSSDILIMALYKLVSISDFHYDVSWNIIICVVLTVILDTDILQQPIHIISSILHNYVVMAIVRSSE